ncbi:hypothetical protein ACJMK2_026899 [Sinanodonta woodiana]|uniref:Uncharacterized protein n=1 Tax=Sinanodonta woodiana TaxID=1069815 RepID=A0ABD3XPK5_SINWO
MTSPSVTYDLDADRDFDEKEKAVETTDAPAVFAELSSAISLPSIATDVDENKSLDGKKDVEQVNTTYVPESSIIEGAPTVSSPSVTTDLDRPRISYGNEEVEAVKATCTPLIQ